MRTCAIALSLLICSVASADTFRLKSSKGSLIKHDHRCASPKATKRLTDFIDKTPQITIGHDQMTANVGAGSGAEISGADVVLDQDGYTWGWWHLTDMLTVIIYIHPHHDDWCKDAHRCKQDADATIYIIQRFDDATCYEEWRGIGEVL